MPLNKVLLHGSCGKCEAVTNPHTNGLILPGMSFADALSIELGIENHVGLLSSRSLAEGIFTLTLLESKIIIKASIWKTEGKCSVWGVELTDRDMTTHMEEDVGIFDPDGLVAYAAYFRDALVTGVGMDFSVNGEEVENLFLVLQYVIGTSKLEGRIKLQLVQGGLSAEAFLMLKQAYHFDPSRKIFTGTRNTPTIRDNARVVQASLEIPDDSAFDLTVATTETPDATAAAAAARAAKKRRVGGVNIFPGMRKVSVCFG